MQSSGHSAAPRPGGGFNAGMGQFGEHLDEAAMMKAMQTKGMQQQKASATTSPTPLASTQKNQKVPRDVGSLTDELIKYPLEDLMDAFKSIADIDMWLGIQPSPGQEQERARKEVILKNFNTFTDEEQAIAKQRYQERMKKMQMEEEEKHRQKQLKAQQQQESFKVPGKAASGPVGPGMSGKQKATNQLNFDRQIQDKSSSLG
jgi:hypothetical protein